MDLDFNPRLVINHVQSDVMIAFDSNCEFDRKRGLSMLRIARQDISALSFDVTCDIAEDKLNSLVFVLDISIQRGHQNEQSLALGQLELHLERQKKSPDLTVDQVKTEVLLGLTEAFMAALSPVGSAIPNMAYQSVAMSPRMASIKPPRSGWRWFFGAAAIVVIAVVALKFLHKDPYEIALDNALNSNTNPDAVKAQVEATKKVLEQLGIDPGKSGDVGCLAQ